MSTLKSTTSLVGSAAVSPHSSLTVWESKASPASRDALFVIPGRGGGLRASIRGHLLELAEVSMTVTVPGTAEALSDALEHALVERGGARSPDEPRLNLRCVA
jgi:hypothetical protein